MEAFRQAEKEEAERIMERVNPLVDGLTFRPDSASVLVQDPDFYPGHSFVEISAHDALPVQRRFAVLGPEKTTLLNWTNEPVYTLNEEVPVHLDDATIIDYVRFFFSYVKGRHGRFLVTESVDDINWKEEPPPAARKAIGKMLRPLSLMHSWPNKDNREEEEYILEASMMFRDSLFRTEINVNGHGIVNLTGEELLIEEMPVMDDTFAQ